MTRSCAIFIIFRLALFYCYFNFCRIPVGITPQNLRNYTLYDVLGLGGEWGAAADTEGSFFIGHRNYEIIIEMLPSLQQ